MDESIRFYHEVLGFEIGRQFHPQPDTAITFMMGQEGAIVELIKSPAHPVGFYSVGMGVENLDAVLQDLAAKNVKAAPPTPISGGALSFIEDPNGVRIALIEHR
jgi:lactoylglutathione lyase